jgi:hypothetical protein
MIWLDFLWSVYSQPELLGGPGDGPFLIGVAVVVVAVTLAFMATIGKRISRRSSVLGGLTGGCLFPALAIALAFALVIFRPIDDGHGGAMLAMMVLVLGLWTAPLSFATSTIYVLVWKRRSLTNRTGPSGR